jgi:hypothetical protein
LNANVRIGPSPMFAQISAAIAARNNSAIIPPTQPTHAPSDSETPTTKSCPHKEAA